MNVPGNDRTKIVIAYPGVHQVFELGRAAAATGLLDQFHCSFAVGPGTWGNLLARMTPRGTMARWEAEGIPAETIREFPWPLLASRLGWINRTRSDQWFDRRVAEQLRRRPPRMFVGVETAALHSLRAAKAHDAITVLDCHGIHVDFRDRALARACDLLKLAPPKSGDSPALRQRKEEEIGLSDHLLVYSAVHRESFAAAGVAPERLKEIPLGIDSFWTPPAHERRTHLPLRLLYAGEISIRKGIPFLLHAAEALGHQVELTLAGRVTHEMTPFLSAHPGVVRLLPRQSAAGLRELFYDHDLGVFPSLGDSFGLTPLEAMACGLPVIVTDHAGVPVPDPSWRVPAMNAKALADRIASYLRQPLQIREDGRAAVNFASCRTSPRYRENLTQFFLSLLSSNLA